MTDAQDVAVSMGRAMSGFTYNSTRGGYSFAHCRNSLCSLCLSAHPSIAGIVLCHRHLAAQTIQHLLRNAQRPHGHSTVPCLRLDRLLLA